MFGIRIFMAKGRMTGPNGERMDVKVRTRVLLYSHDPYMMIHHLISGTLEP